MNGYELRESERTLRADKRHARWVLRWDADTDYPPGSLGAEIAAHFAAREARTGATHRDYLALTG